MHIGRFITSPFYRTVRRIYLNNYNASIHNVYNSNRASFNKSYATYLKNKNYGALKEYNKAEKYAVTEQQNWQVKESLNKLNYKKRNLNQVSVSEFRTALEYVKKEKCGTEQCVLLLQCCSELLLEATPAERVNLTFETWDVTKSIGPVTLECYHAFLLSLADCQYKIDSSEILKEIHELGLKPDEELYIRLLHNVCSVGDVEEATSIISVMKDAGIPLNPTAFDFIILGHGRAGNPQEIDRTLSLMERSRLRPTSSTFTSILQVAAESGNKDTCLSCYKKYRTDLSDIQRLKIVESLAIGQLDDLIPDVLSGGSWGHSVEIRNTIRNTCLKLIYKGYIDSAYKLFESLRNFIQFSDTPTPYGTFFIQEIVKANVALSKIVEICERFKDRNPYVLFGATQSALRSCMLPLALQLLQLLVDEGHKLRPHYFWPLFVHAGKHNGESGVLEVLHDMLLMDVIPDHDTLAEWVCMHCDLTKPVELVRKLQDKGLKLNNVLSPVVQCLLHKNDIKGAAVVCSRFRGHLDWKKLVTYLCMEYLRTEDVGSVKTILDLVKENTAGADMVEFILLQRRVPSNNDALQKLVQTLVKAGYELPQQQIDYTNNFEKGRKFQGTYTMPFQHPKVTNVDELEAQLIQLKSKNYSTRGVLRRLLQEHSRLRNVERVLEIKKELDKQGSVLSAGMMASLFQTFIEGGDVKEAENCLKNINNTYPKFKIDIYKIIDLAILYVRSSRYEDAKSLLNNQKDVVPHESFSKYCRRLLNTVSEHYSPVETNELFNVLITKNYSGVTNHLLGCVIRSYLVKEDLVNAVITYEKLALDNKCTPLQHELLCGLLKKVNVITREAGDSVNVDGDDVYLQLLEKVVGIGQRIHGKHNTNVAFAVSLAECNLVEQLKKFVKTTGNKLDMNVLHLRCKRLSDECKPHVILRIINVIRELPFVNIENFYSILLETYIRQGDCDGALSIWMTLQEENIIVPEKCLQTVVSFLNANKREIPFTIPELKKSS